MEKSKGQRSQHHPGGGKGPSSVWAGGTRARRREAEVPLSLPGGMCGSAGILRCWGGCPRGHQPRGPEHEAGLGEMLEEPAQSRTLPRHVKLGVSESPPQRSPAWSRPGCTRLWEPIRCPCTTAAPLSIGGVQLHLSKLTPMHSPPSAEVAPQPVSGLVTRCPTASGNCPFSMPHQGRAGQEYYPMLQLPLTTTLAPVFAQSTGILALLLKLTCPQTG